MNYFYITGTSTGIGKAIAEKLLEDENNRVLGISRRCTIEHVNYNHVELDLKILGSVANFYFGEHNDANKIVLINNAAMLGEAKVNGTLDNQTIINAYNVNVIAPSILTNNFISSYKNSDAKKVVVNISSGAGKKSIPGWSTYCSGKAALDMMSQVSADEQAEAVEVGVKIFSIAPGIVDTPMQDEIRTSSEADFSRVQNFIDYKNNGELSSPDQVAEKYLSVIANPEQFPDCIFSIRDLS